MLAINLKVKIFSRLHCKILLIFTWDQQEEKGCTENKVMLLIFCIIKIISDDLTDIFLTFLT